MSAFAALAASWKTRLLASPDREHEMAVNRLIAGAAFLLFNALAPAGWMIPSWALVVTTVYLAGGVALLGHLAFRPDRKFIRRQIALAMDLGAVSFEIHQGEGHTAWLYPAYLWIVFGNGFRFGPRQLLVAMTCSFAALLISIVFTPFWAAKPSICAGLLLGQLLIPLYAFSLIDKLSRARQQAVEANRAKSLFLAKVSHELRTPLNAIIGFGALLAEERLDGEQRDMTQTILSSGRSLLSLIDSILDLSRLEAGQMPVAASRFDLCDLLEELRLMVLAEAREKRLSVVLHATARTRTALMGDVARLREILLNLLSNAVKFTESGSVMLSADMLGEPEHDGGKVRLRFEVDDTGIGISPEAQGRIFEMFTQADETIAGRYGGTGLGLSITRQLVELLGGAIGVESQPGQGTTVWVEMDFQSAGPAVDEPRAAAAVRCILVSGAQDRAAPVLDRLQAMGVQVDAAAPPGRDEAPRIAAEIAEEGAPVVLAVIRHSCQTPRLSFGALLNNDALRFLDVTAEAAPARASRRLRRRLTTRVSVQATDAELMRALRYCGGFASERPAGDEPAEVPRAGRSRVVLVADDNRVNQKVMTRILERSGYRVMLAGDGDEMLDILDEAAVDAVVVDVNMPNLNGIEATQIFRVTSLGKPRTPVIGVTADATPETRERCIAAGMDLCLLKPLEPAALVAALDGMLATAGPAVDPAAGEAPAAPTAEADAAVRSIASHPRFRPVASPIIDRSALADLQALGGDAFVAEIIGDFCAEADELMVALKEAAAAGAAEPFRACAHAIRSGGANIGARQLCELAEQWQTVSAEQLRQHGHDYVAELSAQLIRLKRSLAVARSEASANGSLPG